MQFIPARGRKLFRPCGAVIPARLQFIPARGRKPAADASPRRTAGLQFIPARGRKLLVFSCFFMILCYCNLSPRGDGNGGQRRQRRGWTIAIYPREGTETKIPPCVFSCNILQFIPARGRKHPVGVFIGTVQDIAIYPREGTETFALPIVSPPHTIAIYPREGTET